MDIQQMMKQAQQMQERLQKQMAETRVEANAGGGMFTVVMNGSKQVLMVTIDPEVVSKDEVEMRFHGQVRPKTEILEHHAELSRLRRQS